MAVPGSSSDHTSTWKRSNPWSEGRGARRPNTVPRPRASPDALGAIEPVKTARSAFKLRICLIDGNSLVSSRRRGTDRAYRQFESIIADRFVLRKICNGVPPTQFECGHRAGKSSGLAGGVPAKPLRHGSQRHSPWITPLLPRAPRSGRRSHPPRRQWWHRRHECRALWRRWSHPRPSTLQ